jgi:2EXR family
MARLKLFVHTPCFDQRYLLGTLNSTAFDLSYVGLHSNLIMPHRVTSFSSLPTELRLNIWHFSCLIPRLIEIRTDDWPGQISLYPTRHGTKIHDIHWVTKCPAPAPLSVCHESREEALKVFRLRFEVLASEDYTIYINPLLDTVYGNFKWHQEFVFMLLRDMRAFDEEEIGIRKLALPLKYGSTMDPLLLNTVNTLTLVIEDSIEPYWQDWDRNSVLVAPFTDQELRVWEEDGGRASAAFYAAMNSREHVSNLNIAPIRRGHAARALSEEDWKYPVLEGPRRLHWAPVAVAT